RHRCACVPCAHATAICRYAGDRDLSVRRSRRVFAALLKLLLERGALGTRGIRIRLLVTAARITEWLGVVTLAFGTIDTLTAFAPRAAAAPPAVLSPCAT